MSKIGQKHIPYTQEATIEIDNQSIRIAGKEGALSFELPQSLRVEKTENEIIVKRLREEKKVKALHGLFRSLIANAVVGVEKGWEKRLEIVGTGFSVKLQEEDLVFKLGYSHLVVFKKTEGIIYKVEGTTKVVVHGADRQLVGQVAYQIKRLRKPDVYKGKGIRYQGEKLRIKPGKKAKTAGAA